MNSSRLLRLVPLALSTLAVLLVLGFGLVVAQQGTDSTSSLTPDEGVTQTAVTDFGPAPAADGTLFDSVDGTHSGPAPDEFPPQRAPSATFSYFTVAGATLQPRDDSGAHAYGGAGCMYMSAGAGTGRIAITDMHLPEGSVIKYIRLYYNDTNASGSVSAYLTRYAPGTSSSDLVNTSSTASFSGGFGFTVSSEITETVNNASYAYTLIGWPSTTGSSVQVCGIRVAYYAPNTGTFLPVVKRE